MIEKNLSPEFSFCLVVLFVIFPIFGIVFLLKLLFIRPRQMVKIAEKYNLNYSDVDRSSEANTCSFYRSNIISGKIKGRDILLYDISWQDHNTNIITTEIFVDGKQVNLDSSGIKINTLTTIKEIDSILSKYNLS